MVLSVGLIDVGANLANLEFDGHYNGIPAHDRDVDLVLKRAWKNGFEKIIIPGGSLRLSRRAQELVIDDDTGRLFFMAASQPTLVNAFQDQLGPEKYEPMVVNLIEKNRNSVVAVGRVGLDFTKEGLEICPKGVQIAYLKMHLDVSLRTNLPVFLHCRSSATKEMFKVLENYKGKLRGVIYSFDGSLEDAAMYEKFGLHIGITGCSLKTEKNLKVIKSLPLKNVVFGTDCPRCNIKPGYPSYEFVKTEFPAVRKMFWTRDSMVKGRNEPSKLIQVLEVVGGVRGIKPQILAVLNHVNATNLFFPSQSSGLKLTQD